MNIDISKLPRLDCIAAKLYDQIMAKKDTMGEDELVDLLNEQTAQISGKIKRNEHSFMLIFSDNSVLRVDMFIDEHMEAVLISMLVNMKKVIFQEK